MVRFSIEQINLFIDLTFIKAKYIYYDKKLMLYLSYILGEYTDDEMNGFGTYYYSNGD